MAALAHTDYALSLEELLNRMQDTKCSQEYVLAPRAEHVPEHVLAQKTLDALEGDCSH